MSPRPRDNQKRIVAQAVFHLEASQKSLAEFWEILRDDGRPWHELAGQDVPLLDPDDATRVLTGADVLSTYLEMTDIVHSGIAAVVMALWEMDMATLDRAR